MSANSHPAHTLWVELTTRITTQRLHYRSGDEETAARSLYSLFAKTRDLMEKNPAAEEFQKLAERMLNTTIRPYTARWHGWMVPDPKLKDKDGQPLGKFRDPNLKRQFRQELRELQPLLLGYQKAFGILHLGKEQDDAGVPPEGWAVPDEARLEKLQKECQGTEPEAELGPSLDAGILPQVWLGGPPPKPETQKQDGKSMPSIGANEFPGALTAEEIERRERIFLNRRRSQNVEENHQPVRDAIGLALSGGGIKAATFSLGVVQELARRGIFTQVDYLSTVSGGGYFGSFLSAFLGSPKAKDDEKETTSQRVRKALLPQVSGTEAQAVRHLRNQSQYLLNGGLLGKLNIAGVLATGVLANLLMILPLPLIIAMGLALLNGARFWGDVWCHQENSLPTWDSDAGQLFLRLGALLAFLWLVLPGVQRWTNCSKPGEGWSRLRSTWEFATLMMAVITVLAGLLYAYPCVVKGYLWGRDWLTLHLKAFAPTGKSMAAIVGAIPMVLASFGHIFRTRWAKNLLLKSFFISGPIFYTFIILWVSIRLGVSGAQGADDWASLSVAVAVTAILLLLWSLFWVNLNTLAPHRYYRARLCECYLAVPDSPQLNWWGKVRAYLWEGYVPEKETGFGTVQHLKLSSIGESGDAPYHLLNAIINLPASKNRNLRGRGGDFFVMSRDFCGSPATGYVATKRLEASDPQFDLGTAMAISAAAANPNMGWRTDGGLGSLRFLMTLLNVRLGYWLPNYRLCKKGQDIKSKGIKNGSIGSPYLLAEIGGRIQENMGHLNLSDGGHIENLGVYELLRRKCKFIISVDGGAGRNVVGGDLQRLERYAAIDFGIRMDYKIEELQPDEEGFCKAAAILVKIHYSETETGWMVYIRPSITGNEPAYVIDYWKQNPVFPYNSILDQVFSEEQFEGYRCVGECSMASLFREELDTDSDRMTVNDWFKKLAVNLLPDNDKSIVANPALPSPAMAA